MSSLFGYLMGILLIVIGVATAFLAPRVGPNPFFGVRTGYSFANRQVWDRANWVGGWLMAGIGLLMLVVAWMVERMGLAVGMATGVLTVTLMVSLLGGVAWLFWYTRRLALGSATAAALEPVRLDWRLFAPSLMAWGLLAVVMLTLYPMLPETLATHFDVTGQPDGWSDRTSFAILYTGLGLLLAVIPAVVALIAGREPVIGLSRLGGWRVEPREGIRLTSWAMALVNLFLLLILLDLAWFSWYGVHLMEVGLLVLVGTVVLIGGILALFFRYARRVQE